MSKSSQPPYKRAVGSLIFLSRWLQAPLYFGLIVAQCIYVYQFMIQLWHLFLSQLPGHEVAADAANLTAAQLANQSEVALMLAVLGLIDVVMIANLLIMVIIGGYETFVSRLNLGGHPDQPEWLSHVNAGVLKVKLATALIGISSIHLLQSFINAKTFYALPVKPTDPDYAGHGGDILFWQVIIHLTFVGSAIALAYIDRLTQVPHKVEAH